MLTASSYELASAILLSLSNIKLTPNSLPGTVIHVSESGPVLKKFFEHATEANPEFNSGTAFFASPLQISFPY